ncbi:shikimate O-hydroxycinnamoyltransferase-like [Humulus lupulus]|uniref:shikimate O-hydroxycinnamoyltransferase-like n=1 Tax=Humulus lupulus TaxID=3486 RepID=UPI002B4113D5|nr:shikimate O-hydroxycinnamoyltransferase-like [Humulus lupulus]
MIDIKVKERTLVRPAEITTRRSLWLSDLDLLYNVGTATCLYFYKNCSNVVDGAVDGAYSKPFDSTLLKEALAKVLVPYYPIAGRLRQRHDDGRLEIDCNDEGVLFVTAETSAVIDDLGDFCTFPGLLKLSPPPSDYAAGISSFPLLVLQVTYFQCGGVSISVGGEHIVIDGNSVIDFMNAWSAIARGQPNLKVRPNLDRTLLRPRDPPQIMFNHMNAYQIITDKSIKTTPNPKQTTNSVDHKLNFKLTLVKITKHQLNILKSKIKEELGSIINYSTFAILAGLIWKCRTSIACSELLAYEESKLFISVNGRSRFQPSLPTQYFGNVVFHTTTVATTGDLRSKPLWYAVNRIHETLKRFDNDYLRSAIDFLSVHPNTKHIGLEECRFPNLGIVSLAKFAARDADFGWGRPFHMGNSGHIYHEGRSWILDDGDGGNLSVLLSLLPEHVQVFKNLFYESIEENSHISDIKPRPRI